MAKRFKITNLSNQVQTFEGNPVQPRTSRVLDLDQGMDDKSIERWRSRQVFIEGSTADAENDKPLPAADPKLVEAYSRLTTAQDPQARDAVLADLGVIPKAQVQAANRKAEG